MPRVDKVCAAAREEAREAIKAAEDLKGGPVRLACILPEGAKNAPPGVKDPVAIGCRGRLLVFVKA